MRFCRSRDGPDRVRSRAPDRSGKSVARCSIAGPRPHASLTIRPDAPVSGARALRDACAVRDAQLPFPVAGRSAHLVGVRDGDDHPRLVRAGRDRIGALAHGVRRAAISRHLDRAGLRRGRRPARAQVAAARHAGGLRRVRRHAADVRAARRGHAAGRADHRDPDGAGASLGPRRAQRADRRDHAGQYAGQRAEHFAHHHGFGARRRRARRRGACSRSSAWRRPT